LGDKDHAQSILVFPAFYKAKANHIKNE